MQGGDKADSAIVIGGGVVGLSSALALARYGIRATLVEMDATRAAASWGNAGHIAIEQVEPLASAASLRSAPRRLFSRGGALALPAGQWRRWVPFAARMMVAARPASFRRGRVALGALLADAMPAWRRLAATLPGEPLLREDGHIVAWGRAADASAGAAHWAGAVPDSVRTVPLDHDALAVLARVAPGLPPAGAIRFTGTGQIADLGRLANVLEQAFLAAGGRIVRGNARLAVDEGSARVIVGGEPLPPGQVLVAAGVRSGALVSSVGHRAPIIAERGYHIRSADHRWPADLPPLVFEDRSIIVTRYRDQVQVASFVELGDPDAPADPAKWARLESHVAALGLPIRGPFRRWMGARPTLPDYLPALGRSRRVPNLLYAFGHQHLGLTLAPVTAEIVAALALGGAPPIDLAPFDIARFDKGTARP